MTAEREPAAPVPAKRERKGKGTRRRGKGALGTFLLINAIPAAALTWFFLQPPVIREEILGKIPAGAGGRALKAAVCIGVLILLARVALPAFHGTAGVLRGAMARFRARRGILRVVLYPVEALVWLLWFVVQLLFAVDAVLILATGVLALALVARIVKPEFLADFLPELLS